MKYQTCPQNAVQKWNIVQSKLSYEKLAVFLIRVVQGVSHQMKYKKTILCCFWKWENSSENRFKQHISSDFSCKNFIGLSWVVWPQYRFEVKWVFTVNVFFHPGSFALNHSHVQTVWATDARLDSNKRKLEYL